VAQVLTLCKFDTTDRLTDQAVKLRTLTAAAPTMVEFVGGMSEAAAGSLVQRKLANPTFPLKRSPLQPKEVAPPQGTDAWCAWSWRLA
jgi:hypothetical protein